ncbi:MAG: hypothetical protein NC086_04195 [Alistipes sp.]|nr:hypothetical protein [Alistipes sp.]
MKTKERLLNRLKKIFCLRPVPTVLIALPSFLFVIYALNTPKLHPALQYASYILSAYALVITITGFGKIVAGIKNAFWNFPLMKMLMKIPVVRRYVDDPLFRTHISLYMGFLINMLYVAMKIYTGITVRAGWFIVFGCYYAVLAFMKLILLAHIRGYGVKENMEAEWKQYRFCGFVLLFLNVILIIIVIMVLRENRHFEYPGFLIYGMALYAFYAVITAVISLVRFRKHGSPVMSAAKVINFVAALVSMFALETAMLVQFSDEDVSFAHTMNSISGAGLSVITVGLAVYMIVRGAKKEVS